MTENRELFFAKLRSLLAPSEIRKIETAYTLAKFEHHPQPKRAVKDNGDSVRYSEHPRLIALMIIDEIFCVDDDVICAALLYNLFEDTHVTLEHIEHVLGTRVARIVVRLAKYPKEEYYERLIKYGEWEELLIRCCDKLLNLRTLADNEKFREKQLAEAREQYINITATLISRVPSQYKNRVLALEREILSFTK